MSGSKSISDTVSALIHHGVITNLYDVWDRFEFNHDTVWDTIWPHQSNSWPWMHYRLVERIVESDLEADA